MLTPVDLYTYRAALQRVVDGDTVLLDVDLGGHIHAYWNCRLLGYDSASRRSLPGQKASAHLQELLTGHSLIVRTIKDHGDKYGRYLVTIVLPDGRDVCDTMIAAGDGVPWDGHGNRPPQTGAE